MESDRMSERSFGSLNTVNLHEHTTKDKFAVNKDDTVRFYLNSLRDGFDTYAAPDVAPLHEDPPTAARRKISEQQPPLPPQSPLQQQQQQGDVQAKKKRRRRMSEDKENDRPPPPLSQLDALAQSPAQPKPPSRKQSGGVARSTARAAGVRRRGQTPADVIEASQAVRGDGDRSSSSSGNEDGDDDDEHGEQGGSDPLKWFRSRSKPTVEEEFEEFKKRFVWNGSRLAAQSRASGGRAPGDGAEGRNGGTGSGGGISNSGQLAISELRTSGGDAEPIEDRRAPDSRRRQRRAKDALASHDRRQQPSTSAAGAPVAAASEERAAPRGAAVTIEAVARSSALATPPVETAGVDRSTLARRTIDETAATSSGERLSHGYAAAAAASAEPAAAHRRDKHQPTRPSPLVSAVALPQAAKPQLRLPPLAAGPNAAAGAAAARIESLSEEPFSAISEARARAPASVADDADAAAAAATAVGSSVEPSKLATIKHKAKAKEPPPTLSPSTDDSPHPIHRRDSQQSINSGGSDGALPTESVAAKVETIKLLAREKQRQRLKLKRIERELGHSDAAKADALSDPRQQRQQNPAAMVHQMDGGVGRAISRRPRHGELPPLGAEAAAGRQSVDKRCASEVALAAARRRTSDFGEVESRAGASEVHPGRVYNLSMNFDAYVRALERMVDATLKTLAQTDL